jgi:quinol-cytochrome oxidoreductase complex cytochrome b subunit
MKEITEELKNKKIRPKWHFIVKNILFVVLTFLVLLFALFVASFLLFCSARSTMFFDPLFFVLFLLMIVSMIIAEILIGRYAIAYRKPVIYSLIIIFVLVFFLGAVVNKIKFHEKMERRDFPVIKSIYKVPRRRQLPQNFRPEINIMENCIKG